MPTITIRQWPERIDARRQTILDAALSRGVPFPHDCRTGQCGTCKSRLLAGEIEHLPCDPAALHDHERTSGVMLGCVRQLPFIVDELCKINALHLREGIVVHSLACRSIAQSDIEVEWLATANAVVLPVRTVKATVVTVQHVARDVTRLQLGVHGSPLMFAAGQYARVRFGKLPERSYSMANRPDEPTLEFHIRRVPQGRVSSYVARTLAVGDTVRVTGPFGSVARGSREGQEGQERVRSPIAHSQLDPRGQASMGNEKPDPQTFLR